LLSSAAAAYVSLFRGTPLLLQLYIVYQTGPFTSFEAGYIGLTLNLAAFLSEVYRSGLSSIGKRQWEAAFAIGMKEATALRRIIVPQAVLRVIPPLGTFWVSLFRDSALVAFIGVAEVMHAAQQVAISSYRPFEAYTALAVLYIAITYPQARLVSWLYERFRVRE
jgi:ABC-type amino acid transport system permease subunit